MGVRVSRSTTINEDNYNNIINNKQVTSNILDTATSMSGAVVVALVFCVVALGREDASKVGVERTYNNDCV